MELGEDPTQKQLRDRIAELSQQHRDLDAAISSLESGTAVDQLQIRRLKRQKLHIKDEIGTLENQLLPDIIA